jgi:hypothetical protein
LERVSRDGRNLILAAFENRAEVGERGRYTSGELCFDPSSCWAIRIANLKSERGDGNVSHVRFSFELQPRENEPPLLRSYEATWENAGSKTRIEQATTEYDFEPPIDVDDFSPAKYALNFPPRDSRRSPSWFLALSLALVCLSIGGGASALLVDGWLRYRKTKLASSPTG